MKKMSNLGIHTSPDSIKGQQDKLQKKAHSVRSSQPEMNFDIKLDMKREREKLNRVLHIKEKSLLIGQ